MSPFQDQLFHNNDYISLDDKGTSSLIKKLVAEFSTDAIMSEIISVLQTSNEEQIFVMCLFLRDVCIQRREDSSFNKIVLQFRKAVENSNLFEVMNQNLYSDDRLIRETTYRTFGKISFPENTRYLKHAIPYYAEYFPDQLEALEFEEQWLRHQGL